MILDSFFVGPREQLYSRYTRIFLHLTFALFITLALLPESDFLLLFHYFVNFALICFLVLYNLINRVAIANRFSLFPFIVFFMGFYSVTMTPFHDLNFNLLLFNLKSFLLAFVISYGMLSKVAFLKIINSYYLLYLVLSILYWLNLIPFLQPLEMKNEFLVNYGLFIHYVFVGVEGSPTLIGAFSFFVALLNIIYMRNFRFALVAFLFGFLSFRNTALIAFFLSLCTFWIVKSYQLVNFMIAGAFIVFGGVLAYTASVSFENAGLVDILLYKMTHARSMLWGEMLRTMFESYGWREYFLGGYTAEAFNIRFLQVDGSVAGSETSNPHSDILFLLIKWPLMAVMYIALLFYLLLRARDVRFSIVVLFIVIVSIMNSDIVGLRNPVYLLALIYFYLMSRRMT